MKERREGTINTPARVTRQQGIWRTPTWPCCMRLDPKARTLLEHSRHSETPRNHYLPRLSTRFAAIIDLPSPRVRSAQTRETGTCRPQQPQHAAGQHRADRLIS